MTVLPLDVNHSGATWLVELVEGERGLRVPFSAVRGASEAEVRRMVAGRPYSSLADFLGEGPPVAAGRRADRRGRRARRAP